MGDPATELVKVAGEESVDLIAMSTHGHRFLNDLLRGSTADRVRHNVEIPVLMVRAVKATVAANLRVSSHSGSDPDSRLELRRLDRKS